MGKGVINMRKDIKQIITQKTVLQTGLRRDLRDLSKRQNEIGDSTYDEVVERSVLDTQIGSIRSDLMRNRLGSYGLRSLNKELQNTKER
jgi:hypothetical protein